MKKFVLAMLTIVISGCGVINTRDLQKATLVIDYRPYTDAGFFLSPNAYDGQYEPIGQIELIVDPEVTRKNYESPNKYDDGIYRQSAMASSVPVAFTPVAPKELLDMAVAEALELGADGICNLHIKVEKTDYIYKHNRTAGLTAGLSVNVDRYIISGFCIKRID